MKVSYNNWFCCDVGGENQIELCKIKRNKANANYDIITYYNGDVVYSGTYDQCCYWINTNWIEKRYLEEYGKN